MGRRNEWEIYGIRNVSQFCKTTIKHEATKQLAEGSRATKEFSSSLLVGGDKKKLPRATQCYNFHSSQHFPSQRRVRATPSQHQQHQQQQSENKETETKQRQKIGGAKRRRRDYKILMCLSIRHKLYNYHLCIYIYYWIGRLSSCPAWPSLPLSLPLPLLEIFDL